MKKEVISRFVQFADTLAEEARRVLERVTDGGFEVAEKSDASVVTDADLETEKALRGRIAEAYPDHGVLGEELPTLNPDAEYQWILDPIDGTEEFCAGVPTFGSIISLWHKGTPIVGVIDHPALTIRVSGGKGVGVSLNGAPFERERGEHRNRLTISKPVNFQRVGDESLLFTKIIERFPNIRIFDSCYATTCALLGGAGAMFDCNVKIWDIGASKVLVEELGGVYRELRSTSDGRYTVAFGTGAMVEELEKLFNRYRSQ